MRNTVSAKTRCRGVMVHNPRVGSEGTHPEFGELAFEPTVGNDLILTDQ